MSLLSTARALSGLIISGPCWLLVPHSLVDQRLVQAYFRKVRRLTHWSSRLSIRLRPVGGALAAARRTRSASGRSALIGHTR
jgi:hypothetical protein